MLRNLLIAALAFLPAVSSANVTRGVVTTSKIDPVSPARYVALATGNTVVVASGQIGRMVYGFAAPARLVDVIVYQVSAGSGGTSWTVDVRHASSGTSLFTTAPVATLASGTHKVVDAKGDLSLPSGWTRPVIKTDGSEVVTKGTVIELFATETGTYSSHPAVVIGLVFDPLR